MESNLGCSQQTNGTREYESALIKPQGKRSRWHVVHEGTPIMLQDDAGVAGRASDRALTICGGANVGATVPWVPHRSALKATPYMAQFQNLLSSQSSRVKSRLAKAVKFMTWLHTGRMK